MPIPRTDPFDDPFDDRKPETSEMVAGGRGAAETSREQWFRERQLEEMPAGG